MEQVFIETEYITLGQFLKHSDIIQSGGHAKFFLMENEVFVNGEKDDRRGRKLYPTDTISIESFGEFVIQKLTP